LYEFFPLEEVEAIPPQTLLKKPQVLKLSMTVNFNLNRKLDKIYEYTAIYMTSYGEFFCRVFFDNKGISFVEGALHRLKEQLNLPIFPGQVGFYIPRLARRCIR